MKLWEKIVADFLRAINFLAWMVLGFSTADWISSYLGIWTVLPENIRIVLTIVSAGIVISILILVNVLKKKQKGKEPKYYLEKTVKL